MRLSERIGQGLTSNLLESINTNLNEAENNDEIKLFMNTWNNYDVNGADADRINGGWMNVEQAKKFLKDYAEEEPFINDTENVPFEVNEYSDANAVIDNLEKYKQIPNEDIDAFNAILEERYNGNNFDECLKILNDGEYVYFPTIDNSADLGKAYVDMVGFEGVSNIENYINRDEVGEELKSVLEDNGEEPVDEDTLDAMIDEDIQQAIETGSKDYFEKHFDYDRLGTDLEYEGYSYTKGGAIGIFESEKYNKGKKLDEAEINSENSKFLAHILNGVVKDIQSRFDVEAIAEFTEDEDEIVIYIRGNTLDLIDATSYLAKTIRRDDVDFEFDENITDNTVRCYIQPK